MNKRENKKLKVWEYNDEEIKEIGKDNFLTGEKLQNFFDYVKARNFIRKDPYIEEWAGRFSNDSEWDSSDLEGKKILKKLNPEKYEGKY